MKKNIFIILSTFIVISCNSTNHNQLEKQQIIDSVNNANKRKEYENQKEQQIIDSVNNAKKEYENQKEVQTKLELESQKEGWSNTREYLFEKLDVLNKRLKLANTALESKNSFRLLRSRSQKEMDIQGQILVIQDIEKQINDIHAEIYRKDKDLNFQERPKQKAPNVVF